MICTIRRDALLSVKVLVPLHPVFDLKMQPVAQIANIPPQRQATRRWQGHSQICDVTRITNGDTAIAAHQVCDHPRAKQANATKNVMPKEKEIDGWLEWETKTCFQITPHRLVGIG